MLFRSGHKSKGRGGGRADSRLTVDARGILDRYSDQVWMENVPVERIAICKMGAQKTVVDGVEDAEYEAVEVVEF